jgi:multiple sugar transport system permease protein
MTELATARVPRLERQRKGAVSVQRERKRFIALLLLPATSLLLLLTLFPFFSSLGISLMNYSLMTPDKARLIGLGNYLKLLSSLDFWRTVQVTVIFTVAAVGIELALGLLVAVLLHQERRAVGLLRTAYVLPMAVTPVAATFTWRIMYNPSIGVINYLLSLIGIPPQTWLANPSLALPSLIMVDVWQWTPFMLLILMSGLAALPTEPFEAARVDGANEWQSFRDLALPMLRPFILVAVLFRSIDAFKTFDIIYVLTGGGPGYATYTTNLYAFKQGIEYLNMGYAAAIAILMLIAAIIFSRVMLRRTTLLGTP